jgi:predicted metal-dependent hydrolase
MEREFNVSPEEIERGCQGGLPDLALRGLELFNQGAYFEAHEELELAWRAEPGPVRELYRGILQIAVAYYHILRGNYRGAVKMFVRSRTWLAPFPDHCRGVDLARFRQDYRQVEQELLRLGPARLEWLNRGLLKPIAYQEGEGK